jgi:hypothetical protein
MVLIREGIRDLEKIRYPRKRSYFVVRIGERIDYSQSYIRLGGF